MNDTSVEKSLKNEMYDLAFEGWNAFLSEAKYDLELCLNASDAEDALHAQKQGRFYFNINKLKRQINLIHGYEIKNRHILKIAPYGREDDKACQQHTGIVMQTMSSNSGYDTMSEAFRFGALICGSNLIEIYKDRRGDLQFGRLGYNEFMLDPHIKKTDLSDCGYIITGKWLDESIIKLLLPKGSDKIIGIPKLTTSTRWNYLSAPISNNDKRRLYEEKWEKTTEFTDMVVSRATGQEKTFDEFVKQFTYGDRKLANKLIVETRLPNGLPAAEKYSKPTDIVKLSVFVDDEMVFQGENPLGIDDYNFVWLHGEWTPECDRPELKLQPFARILRDPQKMRVRRLNQAMDIIESQIQSGRIVKDKLLKNPEDAYKSGQGVVLHVEDDAAQTPLAEIFQQITPAQMSSGIFQLMEVLDNDETSVGGLNDEILGNDSAEIPGILSAYRTGQALTAQAGIFNGFRAAKRQLGVKLVKAVQKNYPPEKIQRLIQEIPAPTFYEPDFSKYDCIPTEGLLTDTQQNLFYLELKELRALFPDAQQVIPFSALIEASPMQFKDKLIALIKQNEQKAQQMQQSAMQDKQRQDKLVDSLTAVKIAQAQESITQSEENKTNSMLDRAKTMTEMRKINVEPHLKLLDSAIKIEGLKLQDRRLRQTAKKKPKKG
jgi:hypothetical protein